MPAAGARRSRPSQTGAALAIALLLLLALTALAIISVRGPHLETRRAAAALNTRLALEQAEQGLDAAIASVRPRAAASGQSAANGHADAAQGAARYRVDFDAANGVSDVPFGFSAGAGDGLRAFHFDATATGTAGDRTVTLRQSFYIVGPADD